MPSITNTAFEVYVSNSKENATQNITGKFSKQSVKGNADNFKPDECPAGFLCIPDSPLPNEGYDTVYGKGDAGTWKEATGLVNGNSWYMVAAASGKLPYYSGDHTGIYACNTYNVAQAKLGNMAINIPGKTLGLPIPAGERGDFTELIVGEQYNFGAGNFSTLPDSDNLLVVIENGLLKAQPNVGKGGKLPTDGSIFFRVAKLDGRFTEGAFDAGAKYTLLCLRAPISAGAGA